MAVALNLVKDNLCRTETQEHVESDWNMVLVVGYVECDDFFLLVFFVVFNEREDKRVVFLLVVNFDNFFASVDNRFVYDFAAFGHRELNFVANLVFACVERACLQKHANHIVDARIAA